MGYKVTPFYKYLKIRVGLCLIYSKTIYYYLMGNKVTPFFPIFENQGRFVLSTVKLYITPCGAAKLPPFPSNLINILHTLTP